MSHTRGDATHPQLAANSSQLHLLWTDNRLSNLTGNTTGLYTKRWDGLTFHEQLPGDASYRGIANMIGHSAIAGLGGRWRGPSVRGVE